MATGIIIGLIIGAIGGMVIGASLVLIRDRQHDEALSGETCKGTTAAGKPCNNRVGLVRGYCRAHRTQEPGFLG